MLSGLKLATKASKLLQLDFSCPVVIKREIGIFAFAQLPEYRCLCLAGTLGGFEPELEDFPSAVQTTCV